MRVVLCFGVWHLVFYASLTARVSASEPEAQSDAAFRGQHHEGAGTANNGLDRGENQAWYITNPAFRPNT